MTKRRILWLVPAALAAFLVPLLGEVPASADTTPPTIIVPGSITAEATSPAGAVVTFTVTATDDEGTPAVSCTQNSGDTFPLGVTQVTCTATDASGNTASGTFAVTVEDTTPPSLSVPGSITAEATSPAGAVVTFAVAATDTAGPVSVSCSQNSGDTFPLGTTTIFCTATDASGNTSSGVFTVTVADTTPPSLNLPANITTTPTTGSSQATVNYTATATDLVDGPVPVSCDHASGSSFPLGTTTVNCSATDAHGNTATGSFTATVGYAWNGFFQPVDNPPTVNTVKAGSAIPVKFSLTGNQGLNIFASGYPASASYTCNSSAPTDAIETTVTAGSSSLSYDATSDQYTYVWKTDKAWAGSCRALVVKLADGTAHTAEFQLTK